MSKKHQQPIPATKSKGSLWTELNNVHARCVELNQQPAAVADLLRNRELHGHIDNLSHFTQLAKLLQRDAQEFTQRLNTIHAKHVHRSGSDLNPDSFVAATAIHEEYLEWIDTYQNTVIPTVGQIIEIGQKAVEKASAALVVREPVSEPSI